MFNDLCKWDERMRFAVCENESCLPSFSFIPKMPEYFVLGLKERQWEMGTCYNFIFLLFVWPTVTKTTTVKKYKWYKCAVYLKCLCGLGPVSIQMPLETMWNVGVKQGRISKERKDVDILGRVCSIWKYLEPGKCGRLET